MTASAPTGEPDDRPVRLGQRRYGKLGLHVVDVRGDGPNLPPVQVDLAVSVAGGLEAAYLGESNEEVVPSDCLRIALLACVEERVRSGEPLAPGLAADAAHALLRAYPSLPGAKVKVSESPLACAAAVGQNRAYLAGPLQVVFDGGSVTRRSWYDIAPGRAVARAGGGLGQFDVVLRGRHRFTGFDLGSMKMRSPSEGERTLVGRLRCRWEFADGGPGCLGAGELVPYLVGALAWDSESVQHLLARAARCVLEADSSLRAVRVTFQSLPVAPVVAAADGLATVVVQMGPVAVTSVEVER